MKKALSAVLSLSVLFTAAACGGGTKTDTTTPAAGTDAKTPAPAASKPADPVKLRIAWWGGQARHDYTLKVIEMYEKANPNVDIEAEYATFDDYWKKLAPQAAANQLPDIIQMDISYLTQYGGRNQLVDLTPFTKNGLLNVADVSASALSGGKVGDKLVAMNLGVNALQSTMDFEMLKKAGIALPSKNWTWDDMEKMAAQAKAAGKIMGGYRHDVFFPYFLRTQGQKMYSADGASLAYPDDKPFIEYFKRYQKWYDAGYLLSLDKEAQKKGTPEDDEMVMGNSISTNGWSNQFLGLANLAKRDLELQPLPGPNQKAGLFLKPSMYWSITSGSKQQEEAAKFINFWINDIEANKVIKGERGVPVSSKVKEALKPMLSANEAKVFDYVTWAEQNSSDMDPPNPIGSIEVEKLLKDTSEQILYKKITVEDAAAKFRKEANAILAKNKK
ncbi:multiple sugar transport system substrate-binding protein [Paenibacillus sp. UNCCL117]|uniref:ABC transporter substrate-binding protein n=1 Tax=unclassified Paenibacillus TaxID=185978 RepID=UPI00088D5553|nr:MULTISPECIES: ABC transporter substrate-binding protein [unclassified Paenibacillus]SDD37261.1 carbohydrate ABC transporter substrate-binding protein, CUT1 family [Paenibacillus sp. cl123]SFW48814.1 multiple sugar transport system substrate-binding protein [Paenibacillus sp. UNCCL117]